MDEYMYKCITCPTGESVGCGRRWRENSHTNTFMMRLSSSKKKSHANVFSQPSRLLTKKRKTEGWNNHSRGLQTRTKSFDDLRPVLPAHCEDDLLAAQDVSTEPLLLFVPP